ncbi:MAG: lysophospholipid acyltransferase family protein [Nocardioidaceae bacterium]
MIYTIAHGVLYPIFKIGYRPVVEGAHLVPADGPVILACNHLSVIDSVVIPLAAPRRMHYLVKAELVEVGGPHGALLRWLITSLGGHPVQRSDSRSAPAALATALTILAQGDAFGIYPEGTRSRDGRLYRGRTGVGWLALESQAPVVPVGVVGTQNVQPIGRRVPRIAKVAVRFGQPLTFEHLADVPAAQARRAATETIMASIAALSGQERVPTYNTPPAGSGQNGE